MAVPSAHQDEMMLDGEKKRPWGRAVPYHDPASAAGPAPAAILSGRFTFSKWEVGEPSVTR